MRMSAESVDPRTLLATIREVGHELADILTIIQGFGELLVLHVEDCEELREDLCGLQHAADRTSRLAYRIAERAGIQCAESEGS